MALTIEQLQEQNAELIRQLHMYEYENRELREALAIQQDDNDHMRKHAELGETTEKFLQEMKRILR